jgi:short-subunit dehydrogenase
MNKKLSKEQRSIKNRWVLLTGASGGIGEAIAVHLYKAGAKLVLVGRDQGKLVDLRTRNKFASGRAALIVANLNEENGRKKIAAACAKLPEPLSILINNAGITDFSLVARQEAATIENIVTTNLLSPILFTQTMLPVLQKAEYPLIINMGSTFGSIGYSGFAVYSASKFGLRGFTEALRRELANTAIDVCYIAPRATRTAINTDAVNEMNVALGNAMDDPATVAAQVLIAIETRKPEIYIGWPEKLFVKINQLIPKIVDGALLKQLPVITQFSQQRKTP